MIELLAAQVVAGSAVSYNNRWIVAGFRVVLRPVSRRFDVLRLLTTCCTTLLGRLERKEFPTQEVSIQK
jgi:hypothetical protein